MNQAQVIDQSLLRRTMVEVASLRDEDLVILLDIVAMLKEQREASTAGSIRQAARLRAATLRTLPRHQLIAQFREVGERIRDQAVAAGTAIDGDFEGD